MNLTTHQKIIIQNTCNWIQKKLVFKPIAVGGAVLTGCGLFLATKNPSMDEYKTYVGERVVEVAIEKLCQKENFPIFLNDSIKNCSHLISTQRPFLEKFAEHFTTKRNLVICSLYITRFGGQDLLPTLQLPGLNITTIAIASKFHTINFKVDRGKFE